MVARKMSFSLLFYKGDVYGGARDVKACSNSHKVLDAKTWRSLSKHSNIFHSMSLSKLRSGNSEQPENGRRPSGSPLVPIACRICNQTFSDNVSLVLHFESHVNDGITLRGEDLASLQSGQQSSSSRSPARSSPARVDDSHLYEFSLMNDCFRPRSLPANRKPTDRNRIYIPMMSAVPSPSPPIHNSRMRRRYGATSSSTCPFLSSQLGARNSACGSTMAPHLQLREQNGGQTPFSDSKNPPISELEKPNQEIVILSDEEEEEDKSAAEIDLTLKL